MQALLVRPNESASRSQPSKAYLKRDLRAAKATQERRRSSKSRRALASEAHSRAKQRHHFPPKSVLLGLPGHPPPHHMHTQQSGSGHETSRERLEMLGKQPFHEAGGLSGKHPDMCPEGRVRERRTELFPLRSYCSGSKRLANGLLTALLQYQALNRLFSARYSPCGACRATNLMPSCGSNSNTSHEGIWMTNTGLPARHKRT